VNCFVKVFIISVALFTSYRLSMTENPELEFPSIGFNRKDRSQTHLWIAFKPAVNSFGALFHNRERVTIEQLPAGLVPIDDVIPWILTQILPSRS
jgi:hypothetical protein